MSFPNAPSRRSLRLGIKLLVSYLKVNFKLFLLGFVISVSLIGLAPEVFPRLFPKRPQTIGLVGNFTISSLPKSVQKEISFGLTQITPDGDATTGAAISWTATDSGRVFVFKLDENLFWHDGTKFDATQINYNLKGVQIKTQSLNEVSFILKEPFSPLPILLSQPLFKNGLVGLGEYKLDSIKLAGGFVEGLNLISLKSGLRKNYKFFPNELAAVTALKLGSIDQVIELHSSYGLEKDPHYSISEKIDTNVIATVVFNVDQKNLRDKGIRQALAYALPDTFQEGETAFSPISKTSWAYNANVKLYPQSLDIAKKEFAGSESANTKIVLSASPNLSFASDEVANSWRNLGLNVKQERSDTVSRSFDAFLTYIELPEDPDQYAIWHSTQFGNVSGYKSPRVDRLLEEGRQTLDQDKRKAIYLNFQRALTEDVPAAFLFYPKLFSVSRN